MYAFMIELGRIDRLCSILDRKNKAIDAKNERVAAGIDASVLYIGVILRRMRRMSWVPHKIVIASCLTFCMRVRSVLTFCRCNCEARSGTKSSRIVLGAI